MKFSLSQLEGMSQHKPQGYRADALKTAKIHSDGVFEIDDVVLNELDVKWSLPTLWQKIKNLSQAAQIAVNEGLDVRNGVEVEAILTVCATCPRFVQGDFVCGSCGCHLYDEKLGIRYGKVLLKAWHCPLSKW